MEILLLLPGFILAIIVVIRYGNKIHSNSSKIGKNNVHFYVARDKKGTLWLYLEKPVRDENCGVFVAYEHGCCMTLGCWFKYIGLNIEDYKDLKWEDEPVEVFLNIKD